MSADPKILDKVATYLRVIQRAETLEDAKREAYLALALIEKSRG